MFKWLRWRRGTKQTLAKDIRRDHGEPPDHIAELLRIVGENSAPPPKSKKSAAYQPTPPGPTLIGGRGWRRWRGGQKWTGYSTPSTFHKSSSVYVLVCMP